MIKHHKLVVALPGTLEKDSIYLVRTGAGFDLYATNGSGTIVSYPINAQPPSPQLSALAALTKTANQVVYMNASGDFTIGDFTTQGRALVACTSYGAMRTALSLDQVSNTSDADKLVSIATQAALDGKVSSSLIGANNGVASLDSSGKVPAGQLPSYVDDVLEYTNRAAFPGTGESGKIYVADDTNAQWRWSGSTYVQLTASPGTTDAVPEGSTNLYFLASRVLATVLTGISFTVATAVVAGDSILVALGKLQRQITDLASNKLDATANAASATKLATARNINGVAFDGTANITVADGTKEPSFSILPVNKGGTGQTTALPFTKEYVSAETAIAGGGTDSQAHGLGGKPKFVTVTVICKTAEMGYAVGDEVPLIGNILTSLDSGINLGISAAATTTNIKLKIGTVGIGIMNLSTGVPALLTNTSWRIIIRAWA